VLPRVCPGTCSRHTSPETPISFSWCYTAPGDGHRRKRSDPGERCRSPRADVVPLANKCTTTAPRTRKPSSRSGGWARDLDPSGEKADGIPIRQSDPASRRGWTASTSHGRFHEDEAASTPAWTVRGAGLPRRRVTLEQKMAGAHTSPTIHPRAGADRAGDDTGCAKPTDTVSPPPFDGCVEHRQERTACSSVTTARGSSRSQRLWHSDSWSSRPPRKSP